MGEQRLIKTLALIQKKPNRRLRIECEIVKAVNDLGNEVKGKQILTFWNISSVGIISE